MIELGGCQCRLLLRIETERFELPTPFGGSVAQPLDVDASRQAALDRGSDQVGREEGERDRHVDMADAALLAQSNLLSFSDGAGDDLVQPATAFRDGSDQTVPAFRPLRSDLASRYAMSQQDLPESFGRRLQPGN